VGKKGVKAKDHAIIYTDKHPVMLPGEKKKGMTKKPIRMEPSGPRHKLDKASRLNYTKLYTVEYNVKVWFIGKIHEDSAYQLAADYNKDHPVVVAKGYPQPSQGEYTHSGAEAGVSSSQYGQGSITYQQPYSSLPTTSPYIPRSFGTNDSSYSTPGPIDSTSSSYTISGESYSAGGASDYGAGQQVADYSEAPQDHQGTYDELPEDDIYSDDDNDRHGKKKRRHRKH
jgi:hypothetical protein